MAKPKSENEKIVPVQYDPPTSYGLDLEILSISSLRQRSNSQCRIHTLECIEFYLLIYIAEGQCTHMVDFESIACTQGSLLVLRPGQIQRFDMSNDWQGYMLIFRPEFLQPKGSSTLAAELEIFQRLEKLPAHLCLDENQQEAAQECIIRMSLDTQLKSDTNTLHTLLRNQLHTLITRLHLIQADERTAELTASNILKRFIRYRLSVEQHFSCWHRVADYAKHLGCTEKSLSRAANEVAGISAKAFLSKRITLEAKRLLSHTGMPISAIANNLGFDEATNFIKFFRRETNFSPNEFRQQQKGH
jgi:AraC-like DNA-binding protein